MFAVVSLALLGLLVYCLLDLLRTPAEQVRSLPKPLWLLLMLLAAPVGVLGWLFVGRPVAATRPAPSPKARPSSPRPPDDDEEFLRSLRRRAEEQRRRAARDAEEHHESDPPGE